MRSTMRSLRGIMTIPPSRISQVHTARAIQLHAERENWDENRHGHDKTNAGITMNHVGITNQIQYLGAHDNVQVVFPIRLSPISPPIGPDVSYVLFGATWNSNLVLDILEGQKYA